MPDYEGEIAVNKGDVIGIIENNVEGSSMCKVLYKLLSICIVMFWHIAFVISCLLATERVTVVDF